MLRRIIWRDATKNACKMITQTCALSTTSRSYQLGPRLSGYEMENPATPGPKGVPRDFLSMIQKKIDVEPETLRRFLKQRRNLLLKGDQIFRVERHEMLGPDLACAHFVTFRGGKVAFAGSERWYYQRQGSDAYLPKHKVGGMKLEAVDCSRTLLMNVGLENFSGLEHLKYFNISECWYMNDYCLDMMSTILPPCLLSLDISGCPNITDTGLAILYRFRNLKHLNVANLPGVKHKAMVCLLLEDLLPDCLIQGVNYDNFEPDPPESAIIGGDVKTIEDDFIKKHVPAMRKVERLASFLPKNSSWTTKVLNYLFPKKRTYT